MGFHFASLIVHTADTSRVCARQASRDKRTWNGQRKRSTRRRGLDAPDPGWNHEHSDVPLCLREAFSFRRLRLLRGRNCSASRKDCSSLTDQTSRVARCPFLATSVRTATVLATTNQQSDSSSAKVNSSTYAARIRYTVEVRGL